MVRRSGICLDSVVGYGVDPGGVRTSEVAARAEVNVETLRYYERRGLLAEPARSASGYRAYLPEAVGVVRFVKRAQAMGFTLVDIEQLLQLAEGGPDPCEAVRSMARVRIEDLNRRIADLRSMRDALARLVETCDLPRARRDCPLLDAVNPGCSDQHGDRP
jgi:MerR family transcriptional regulator, mercuric resistance operon regulatory protein